MNEIFLNIFGIVLNTFNGIACYQKFKISKRKIFLFGIVVSIIGTALGYAGLLLSYKDNTNLVESGRKEEETNDK